MHVKENNQEEAIVLIDKECPFCSRAADFIIRKGGERHFTFLSLFSEEGKSLLKAHGLPVDYERSLVLVEGGKAYLASDAALRIARHLKGAWPWLYGLIIIPRFIRDRAYHLVAKHRHKLL